MVTGPTYLKPRFFRSLLILSRQAVAYGNLPLGMALVENRFAAGKAPEIVTQASELVPYFLAQH